MIRDAEYIGIWIMLRRFMRGGMGRFRSLHRHHRRVWAIFASIFWGAFTLASIYGLIILIHIQTSEKAYQLMGTCLVK